LKIFSHALCYSKNGRKGKADLPANSPLGFSCRDLARLIVIGR
jgi:hypothetical protein